MAKDISITELRSNLRRWLQYVREGRDVVITERGTPVARLSNIRSSTILERLAREGVIAPAVHLASAMALGAADLVVAFRNAMSASIERRLSRIDAQIGHGGHGQVS
jgi:prevent-host-death family protein